MLRTLLPEKKYMCTLFHPTLGRSETPSVYRLRALLLRFLQPLTLRSQDEQSLVPIRAKLNDLWQRCSHLCLDSKGQRGPTVRLGLLGSFWLITN